MKMTNNTKKVVKDVLIVLLSVEFNAAFIISCTPFFLLLYSFLSIEGLYKSMGYEKRNSSYPQFTDHCFTGDYPIKPVDVNDKNFLENKLSLISKS